VTRCAQRNVPEQPWISPKVRLEPSSIHGTGMVVTERTNVRQRLVVFGGAYTDADGAARARAQGKVVMQWDEALYSIEDREDRVGGDATYFINHSCNPNLWMEDAFTLVARRQIEAGEELVADYALWEADEAFISSWECRCGAPDCRTRITGADWRLPELRKRYAGHFSPLLNKRIRASFGIVNK
jgi:hypothetical protein